MPHDHNLAAELLPKNIIWGEFLGPRSILWPTPILFFSLAVPPGFLSFSVPAHGARARRGARIGDARNEAQPRSF
jgi:hypothetical protein